MVDCTYILVSLPPGMLKNWKRRENAAADATNILVPGQDYGASTAYDVWYVWLFDEIV